MKLLLNSHVAVMVSNGGIAAETGDGSSFKPVVKLFCPWGNATWLLSELDPMEPDRAFGLCDLGMGYPELGYVMISELEAIRGPAGLKIERDIHWSADKPISEYAQDAREKGAIAA